MYNLLSLNSSHKYSYPADSPRNLLGIFKSHIPQLLQAEQLLITNYADFLRP